MDQEGKLAEKYLKTSDYRVRLGRGSESRKRVRDKRIKRRGKGDLRREKGAGKLGRENGRVGRERDAYSKR